MNATRNYIWFGSFLLALLVLCSGAQLATGQAVAGEFTLPFDAQWGHISLPAGHYSFTLGKGPRGGMQILRRGTKSLCGMFVRSYDWRASDNSYLTVVRENGVNTITELTLASESVVIQYPQHHRNIGRATGKREMSLTLLIPVALSKR
jgi:hypothetical protein